MIRVDELRSKKVQVVFSPATAKMCVMGSHVMVLCGEGTKRSKVLENLTNLALTVQFVRNNQCPRRVNIYAGLSIKY